MQLDQEACYRALQARDPRFDGRFFTAVRSTGVYCRPICPARTPKRANCLFVPCAAAAQEAGFRPCLRCRPESSPGTPAWAGTSTTVARGLRLIGGGALDHGSVTQLAGRLGIGERHLRRLFMTHVGASPQAIALTRRVLFAKQLINETNLPLADVAFSAGFSSIRRFNDAMLAAFQRSPRALRRSRAGCQTAPGQGGAAGGASLSLRLAYRPPLDWSGLLRTLQREAPPGVVRVVDESYIRTFRLGDSGDESEGRVRVRLGEKGNYLVAELELSRPGDLIRVADRLRRIFDLHAVPQEIERVLTRDARLRRLMRGRPGVRIAGAWDPFEFAVTALVLGPRPGATGLQRLAALVQRWGRPLDLPQAASQGGGDWPCRLFPSAATLAGASLGEIGLPTARTRTLAALAGGVAKGDLELDSESGVDPAISLQLLRALPGLAEATAQRIALRGLGQPDSFPAADMRLRRLLAKGDSAPLTASLLARRAERWKPWRGYAAVLLGESTG